MIRKNFIYYSICLFAIYTLLNISNLKAGDKKDYISVSTALFDVVQKANLSLEGRLEYRYDSCEWILKPFGGMMTNTQDAHHVYSGVYIEIPITSFLSFTPSFAPGIYFEGNSKQLYYNLEFRSQLEFILKLPDSIQIGLSINHISNAGIGKLNPGVESIALSYFFPI